MFCGVEIDMLISLLFDRYKLLYKNFYKVENKIKII